MKIRCMVVDDEPLARRVLEKHIEAVPSLELVNQCASAMEAAAFLHRQNVDVMFLDIKMPELTGIDFLKTLPHPPQVIITTAFSQYALEGYEYSVVDYLLKPIAFERFLKAVNKLKKQAPGTPPPAPTETAKEDFIFLKSDQTYHKVAFAGIRYIQGYGNYVKVFTDEKRLLVSETMTNIEAKLPAGEFVRTHKSFIVAIRRIDRIKNNKITIGDAIIPIGQVYKTRVTGMISMSPPARGLF